MIPNISTIQEGGLQNYRLVSRRRGHQEAHIYARFLMTSFAFIPSVVSWNSHHRYFAKFVVVMLDLGGRRSSQKDVDYLLNKGQYSWA